MRECVWKGKSKDQFRFLLGETKIGMAFTAKEMVERDQLGWECHSGYSELEFPMRQPRVLEES